MSVLSPIKPVYKNDHDNKAMISQYWVNFSMMWFDLYTDTLIKVKICVFVNVKSFWHSGGKNSIKTNLQICNLSQFYIQLVYRAPLFITLKIEIWVSNIRKHDL